MEFTLDISIWKCGYGDVNPANTCIGKGVTRLVNEEGYRCCVGQFAGQCGIPHERLCDRGTLAVVIGDPNYNVAPLVQIIGDRRLDTLLYDVNDDTEPLNGGGTVKPRTIREKVDAIRSLLESAGHTLKVVHEELILA